MLVRRAATAGWSELAGLARAGAAPGRTAESACGVPVPASRRRLAPWRAAGSRRDSTRVPLPDGPRASSLSARPCERTCPFACPERASPSSRAAGSRRLLPARLRSCLPSTSPARRPQKAARPTSLPSKETASLQREQPARVASPLRRPLEAPTAASRERRKTHSPKGRQGLPPRSRVATAQPAFRAAEWRAVMPASLPPATAAPSLRPMTTATWGPSPRSGTTTAAREASLPPVTTAPTSEASARLVTRTSSLSLEASARPGMTTSSLSLEASPRPGTTTAAPEASWRLDLVRPQPSRRGRRAADASS